MSRTNWLERCVLATPCLTLCLTKKAFLRAYRRVFKDVESAPDAPDWVSEGVDATMHTLWENDNISACIVCLDDSIAETLSQLVALIAHEAQHIVQEVQRQYDELPLDNDEMECRLLDHVVMRLVESYMEQTNRPDKLPGHRRKKRG